MYKFDKERVMQEERVEIDFSRNGSNEILLPFSTQDLNYKTFENRSTKTTTTTSNRTSNNTSGTSSNQSSPGQSRTGQLARSCHTQPDTQEPQLHRNLTSRHIEPQLHRNLTSRHIEPQLHRNLTSRHISMIAIGGTIGTGLFIGSGATLAIAGPGGALLGFSIVGLLVWCVMNSLGELATFLPVSGAFTTFAGIYVEPALAYALGWNYWIQWAVSFPSELSAAGLIMGFWLPNVPSFVWAASILVLLVSIHLFGVKGFGETEYWLSLIKVVAIVCFIVAGIAVDVGLVGVEPKQVIGFRNWTIEGAPFKNGIAGVFKVFLLAFFAFGGTELIGVTAGEAQNPKTTIPKAVKKTFWRILLFYVVSILVMGLVIPNNDPSLLESSKSGDITIAPFTLVFQRAGLSLAAHIMNGVVFSAVISAGNSALFAASRTLMALSLEGKAPRIFSLINTRGVPVYSILATSLFGCISFLGIFMGDGTIFLYLIQVTGISGILTWMCIAIIHIRFRMAFKAQNRDPKSELVFLSPLYPLGPIIALILGIIIVIGQGYVAASESLYLFLVTFSGIPLFFGLYFYSKLVHDSKLIPLTEINLSPTVLNE